MGILVLNYPEDNSDAIDRKNKKRVLKLLNDDKKAIQKAIRRSRVEYGQVHFLYNQAKEGYMNKIRATMRVLNKPRKGSYVFADTGTWDERVYLHYYGREKWKFTLFFTTQ